MSDPTTMAVNELVRAAATAEARGDLDALLVATIRVARDATGSKYAAMGILGEHGALRDFIHVGMEHGLADRIGHLPVGRGVLGTLVNDPSTIVVDDISTHPDSVGFPPHHPEMKNFLGVPIVAGREVFGNLYLTDSDGGFDEHDIEVVETLAAMAGSAIQSMEMRERLARLAVAEDRERIARDLHDAVIQDLFAVGLGLQATAVAMAEGPSRQRLEDATERIDDAIAGLRTFIFDLRSLGTLQTTMHSTIENMVGRIAGARGATWQIDVASDLGSADSGALDNALLIIREAVSNAVRHGGAQHLDIKLHRSGAGIVLAVEDDGSGFDTETATRGMGIRNMEARAQDDGGSFEIRSSAEGTAVEAEIRPRS